MYFLFFIKEEDCRGEKTNKREYTERKHLEKEVRRLWINRHWKLKREWMQEIADKKLEPSRSEPGSWIDVIECQPDKISMVDHQISWKE